MSRRRARALLRRRELDYSPAPDAAATVEGMLEPRESRAQAPLDPPRVELERELAPRTVVIGDLNGHESVLRRFLIGLRLIRPSGAWRGGRTVLVQVGDLVNRGPRARAAMDLLRQLRPEARAAGGEVICLLGNHEVMSALQLEAFVSADEYLEFASPDELEAFQEERTRRVYEHLGSPIEPRRVEPMDGIVRAWEEAHAPGRAAYRAAMSASGVYGRHLRSLPVAVRLGPLLFVHGGLTPAWARLGLGGLDAEAQRLWLEGPRLYQELPPRSLFRDPLGPLWHRAYATKRDRATTAELKEALAAVGARKMVVGHTRTDAVVGGRIGEPLALHGGRLVMCDVGLGEPGEPGSALVIERNRIESWSPGGARRSVVDLGRR
jgi:hypothetical protein